MTAGTVMLRTNSDLLFSVTMKDCKLETFPASGAGGQHRDHGNTAVRITHIASGAVGEGRDSRSQLQNKRNALGRLSRTPKFRAWVNREAALRSGLPTPEELTEKEMAPQNLKTEVKVNGRWAVVDPSELS